MTTSQTESKAMEYISSQDGVLATIIIYGDYQPTKTAFLTEPTMAQQVGFVVYPEGGQVKRHVHKLNDRVITGTSEALFIRSGRCEIDVYDHDKRLLATRKLKAGDFILMISGGHGFRVLEPTVFLEVKLGPYAGTEDKELF